jgi:hypothetical protein
MIVVPAKTGTGGPRESLYTHTLLEEAFGDFASLDISEQDGVIGEGGGPAGCRR